MEWLYTIGEYIYGKEYTFDELYRKAVHLLQLHKKQLSLFIGTDEWKQSEQLRNDVEEDMNEACFYHDKETVKKCIIILQNQISYLSDIAKQQQKQVQLK